MTDAFAQSQVPFLDMAANQGVLAQKITEQLSPAFTDYGLSLDTFNVENLSLPDELQKVLDQRISMNMIGDMNKFTQYEVAQSIPIAAANEGGGAVGIGAGLGAGMAIGQTMANAVQNAAAAQQQPAPPQQPPPPLAEPAAPQRSFAPSAANRFRDRQSSAPNAASPRRDRTATTQIASHIRFRREGWPTLCAFCEG